MQLRDKSGAPIGAQRHREGGWVWLIPIVLSLVGTGYGIWDNEDKKKKSKDAQKKAEQQAMQQVATKANQQQKRKQQNKTLKALLDQTQKQALSNEATAQQKQQSLIMIGVAAFGLMAVLMMFNKSDK